jgi:hypothetical protein
MSGFARAKVIEYIATLEHVEKIAARHTPLPRFGYLVGNAKMTREAHGLEMVFEELRPE